MDNSEKRDVQLSPVQPESSLKVLLGDLVTEKVAENDLKVMNHWIENCGEYFS